MTLPHCHLLFTGLKNESNINTIEILALKNHSHLNANGSQIMKIQNSAY